jgi:predicted methyltransferase
MRVTLLLLVVMLGAHGQTGPASSSKGSYHLPPDPTRDPWQRPDEVIAALNFSKSETVIVIEDGYPYFPQRIAPLVKSVYAVNADARAFQGRGTLAGIASTVVGSDSDPRVVGLNADTVIMVDALRFVPQRALYFLALTAGLKPGGRLVIIDRNLPSVIPLAERLDDATVKAELPLSGFTLAQQFTFLPYQYFLVFQR